MRRWGHGRLIAIGRRSLGGLVTIRRWGLGGLVAIARMEVRNIGQQAFFQRSRATTMQGVCLVAAHIGVYEFPAHIVGVMRCLILCEGHYLDHYPIVIDPFSV